MANKALLPIITFFLGICIFYSCTKVDSDDGHPVIEFLSLDSVTPLKSGDIMYTDSFYILKSTFKSNGGLSSYSVQIWSAIMKNSADTFTLKSSVVPLPEGAKDSAIFNKAFQDANIWGIKDTSVTVYTSIRIDSALSVGKSRLPILLGPYYLRVSLLDMYGSLAKDSFLIEVKRKPKDVPKKE